MASLVNSVAIAFFSIDYALSGLHVGGGMRRHGGGVRRTAVRLYNDAIGCAELRFAPIPRRGIISIEKGQSPFSPIPRRGLIENGEDIKALRAIGEIERYTVSIIHLVFFYKGVHELAALG
jgi:hypothetical protein